MYKLGVFSTFPPTQCGIATYSEDLYNALTQEESDIDICKFDLSFTQKKPYLNNYVIRNFVRSDFIDCCDYINASNFDLIDIQHEFKIFGLPDGEFVEILLDKIQKPITTTLHTVFDQNNSIRCLILQKILNRSESVFIFSEYAKDWLTKRFNVNEDKLVIIPHGVPRIKCDDSIESLENKRLDRPLIFISTGHLRETKGYEIALVALSKLKKKLKNFQYYIVGANHPQNDNAIIYRHKIEHLVLELGLTENVKYVDKYLPVNELIKLIQFSDICLLPYTRKEQSSSGVLALMIACGRPIVSTPFQFAKSCISDMNGQLSDSFTSDSFAKSILELLEKKPIFNNMRLFAQNQAKTWTWENVSDIYYSNYIKIIKKYQK